MYAVYKQAHPPTGLEFAMFCHFFNAAERNLVVAGTSQLYVYRLNHDCEVPTGDPPTALGMPLGLPTLPHAAEGKGHKEKLELMASFSFFGNVMSMASVQLAGAKRDALLLSFKDAKLSVVEYDPGTHDLKTLSLHYFEEPELRDGFVQNVHTPRVRVDPDGRCAVMLIYGTRLVVLPFRRDSLSDEHEGLVGEGQKSSFLPSYIIDVRELDEKLLNIIDMQFLYGYYEPTLLILFEPNQTWPGRVAVRQDTCSIVAISLNITQKVHPVIWSLSNLPFDCTQALAVPKPIGGVVIFAVNSLLYLNQSVPPYGVALNSLTNGTTVFPLRVQEGVKITLDCAQATFISYDKMVISLKGGEIYVLTLITDGMRSVRSFHFDKAAASVLTTCMVTLEPGYLFLGSRLGNSLLLKYTEKPQEPPANGGKEVPERQEGATVTGACHGVPPGGKSAPQDEVDEIEVYGSEAQSGTQLATYSFEVCDSILNIGPCANAAMGEPAFLSEEFQNSPEPDLEIVLCSGYGKNGALSVLQRSIRPQVVTTFELPGCYDMWTVLAPRPKDKAGESAAGENAEKEPPGAPEAAEEEEEEEEEAGKRHGFLILSREDSTMILQTGQEIMELDTSGFATQGPTVFAGNIGDGRYIVQVSPLGIRLLEGVNQLHFIPVDLGSPIVHCAVADPFVVILSAEGQIATFLLKSDTYGGRTHRLAPQKPQPHHPSRVIALCLYRDVSGLFTTESRSARDEPAPPRTHPEVETLIQDIGDTVDDEEEMLYGESVPAGSPPREELRRGSQPSPAERQHHQHRPEPTHWCVLVRENGAMEIHQLPEWRLVFLVKNFPVGQRVLVDSSFGHPAPEAKREEGTRQGELPLVREVLLVALGNRQSRPYLLVHVEQELLIYEAFAHDSQLGQSNLKVRFKKVSGGGRGQQGRPTPPVTPAAGVGGGEEPGGPRGRVARFRPFQDIYGYSGVSVGGLFLGCLGYFGVGGSPIPLTEGYFSRGGIQGELRISVLPASLSYDAPWPVRKIPLRCTPHYVAYHVESKVYAVATSVINACTRIPRMTGEEKEFESIDRGQGPPGTPPYPRPRHPLAPLSPVAHPFPPWVSGDTQVSEGGSRGSQGSLSGHSAPKGHSGGTQRPPGAAGGSRGMPHPPLSVSSPQILIMDVIEVVPEPGQPLTKNKFKVLYEKEQKGPVTALCHCNGYLVSAIGQKIFLWSLKDNELTGMAFIDTQLYIHQMISVKNFILAADLMKSISLLRYQEESKTLSLVSRDAKPLEVYSVDFMVDSTQLGFLVSDRDQNLLVYMYLPEAKESFGGLRLLRRADFHVGAHVPTFWRTPCRGGGEGPRRASAWDTKHITWFATLDGGLGLLLPMQEKTFRRLLMLQNALGTALPHHAGLNPRAFRLLHAERRGLQNAVRNVLDGELLGRYLFLSTMERGELAKKIGTTPDIV
ncbi:CPSF1 factor, partial [Bucorvus abyssinicus]|nr:CPSF1 factor [Bucorvus abyssinicus]